MKILKIPGRFCRESRIGSRIELCGTTIPVRGKQKRRSPTGNRKGRDKEIEGTFLEAKGREYSKKERVVDCVGFC